jgi:hypothetical protein
MRERLHRLTTLQLVTIEANLWLGRCLQHGVCAHVTVVAVDTGHLVDRVRAGMPAEADIAVVAVETLAVVILDGFRARRTEEGNGRPLLAAPYPACVVTAGPVTGLALQLAVAERAARIIRVRMRAAEQREYGLVLVAGQAGIRTFAAVGSLMAASLP